MRRAGLGLVLAAGALASLGVAGCGPGQGGGVPVSQDSKTLLAQLPAPYDQADLANGAALFSQCRSCHTIADGGANMTGPNLYGVFGRKAATKTDFTYSDALKTKSLTWDATTLDQWLTGPQAFAPGTKMSYPGLKDPKDRRDVIGYLKVVSSSGAS